MVSPRAADRRSTPCRLPGRDPGDSTSRPSGARGGAGALLAALLFVASGPAAAAAQEEGAEAGPGWLGVGLRPLERCAPEEEADGGGGAGAGPERPGVDGRACPLVYFVASVVEDGPADRGGVEPGDTIVAVEGERKTAAEQRREPFRISPGEPVEVRVARGDRRFDLRIEPIRQPDLPRRVRVRVATADGGEVARPVILVPSPERPEDPPAGGAAGAAADARRAEGDPFPLPVPVRSEVHARLPPPLRAVIMARESLERTVLPPEIADLRDSVLRLARARIDSLRRAHRERMREPGRRRAVRRAPGSEAEEVRAAGAEFRPLTSGLSEYFHGVEQGLLVLRVLSGTPAALLGLRPGDVVTRVGGQRVTGAADLREALERYPEAGDLVVKWIRKGEAKQGVLKGSR